MSSRRQRSIPLGGRYRQVSLYCQCVSNRDTEECCYNTVQYHRILQREIQWLWQNTNQSLYSQRTPHISPSWASYGVSIVRILEKIDQIIMTMHCTAILCYHQYVPVAFNERQFHWKCFKTSFSEFWKLNILNCRHIPQGDIGDGNSTTVYNLCTAT